jgi:hypothetical protein
MRISVEGLRRVRNRSVPLPPPFDPTTLPDNALLTAKELAGWLRLSLSTLESWRLRHPERGPPWILVAGQVRYCLRDVRQWLLTDRPAAGGSSASRSPGSEAQIVSQ